MHFCIIAIHSDLFFIVENIGITITQYATEQINDEVFHIAGEDVGKSFQEQVMKQQILCPLNKFHCIKSLISFFFGKKQWHEIYEKKNRQAFLS